MVWRHFRLWKGKEDERRVMGNGERERGGARVSSIVSFSWNFRFSDSGKRYTQDRKNFCVTNALATICHGDWLDKPSTAFGRLQLNAVMNVSLVCRCWTFHPPHQQHLHNPITCIHTQVLNSNCDVSTDAY